jgi:hypothetical protein
MIISLPPGANTNLMILSERSSVLLAVTLLLIFTLYGVQLATPLRLNGDATVLLLMASSAAENGEFLFNGKATYFPTLYPFVVSQMLRLGVASPFFLILANYIALVIGAFFT